MKKELIKDARVRKDMGNLKQKKELKKTVENYFNVRDKTSRGSDGLVQDTSEILKGEIEVKTLLYEESLKDKPLPIGTEPMFNTMFLTARRNKVTTDSGLYLPTAAYGSDGEVDLNIDFAYNQKVLVIGPQCQQVKPGMIIKINIENFKNRINENMETRVNASYEYVIPMVEIDGVEYIRISERDVDYIVDNNKKQK